MEGLGNEEMRNETDIAPDSEQGTSEELILSDETLEGVEDGASQEPSASEEKSAGLSGAILDAAKGVGELEPVEASDTEEEASQSFASDGSLDSDFYTSVAEYQQAMLAYQQGILGFSVFVSVALGVLVGCVLIKIFASFFRR